MTIAVCRRIFLIAALGSSLVGCDMSRETAPAGQIDRHAVFFAPDSAILDDPARQVIRRLSDAIRAERVTEVLLEAFANRTDQGAENRILADQRAVAITRALEAAGTDPKIIRTVVIGAAQRIGPSALEGRRVDVTLRR